jgi:hypothetical protein
MAEIKRPSPILHRRNRPALSRNAARPNEDQKQHRRGQRKETTLHVKVTHPFGKKRAEFWVAGLYKE